MCQLLEKILLSSTLSFHDGKCFTSFEIQMAIESPLKFVEMSSNLDQKFLPISNLKYIFEFVSKATIGCDLYLPLMRDHMLYLKACCFVKNLRKSPKIWSSANSLSLCSNIVLTI